MSRSRRSPTSLPSSSGWPTRAAAASTSARWPRSPWRATRSCCTPAGTGTGSDRYGQDAPYLTRAGARWLADHGARLVGIDSVNIDDAADGERPAHSLLLAAGIPVVEHLTGLDQVPATGARFTATPPRLRAFGTFPVRAFASVPGASPAPP
jgi:kynurenine formamidase